MDNTETAMEEFERLAYLAGGLYRERIIASARLAITMGESPQSLLGSLVRNRGEWFDSAEGERRRRKMKYQKREYHNAG